MFFYNLEKHIAIATSPKVASTSLSQLCNDNPNIWMRSKIHPADCIWYFLMRDPVYRFASSMMQYFKDTQQHFKPIDIDEGLFSLNIHFLPQVRFYNQYREHHPFLLKYDNLNKILPDFNYNLNKTKYYNQVFDFIKQFENEIKILYNKDIELYEQAQ